MLQVVQPEFVHEGQRLFSPAARGFTSYLEQFVCGLADR